MIKKGKRRCPECHKIMHYSCMWSANAAEKIGSLCKSCCKLGKKNPSFGNHRYYGGTLFGEQNPMYGKKGELHPFYGKHHTKETKQRLITSHTGKKMSEEAKLKIRLFQIERISKERFGGNRVTPTYNIDGCQKIDEYGKQHAYKFQHAMNGGEFYLPQLGYWADGYDKKNNVWIEYYEKWHNSEYRRKRDAMRKKQIIKFLKCKFIEIRE